MNLSKEITAELLNELIETVTVYDFYNGIEIVTQTTEYDLWISDDGNLVVRIAPDVGYENRIAEIKRHRI